MSDDKKVVKLVTGNPTVGDKGELAAKLRELADEIDRGEWGNVMTVATVIETSDGDVMRHTSTTLSYMDKARLAGLFAFAQHSLICSR